MVLSMQSVWAGTLETTVGGRGSDVCIITVTEQPAGVQPRMAAQDQEIVLQTFRKTNISKYQNGDPVGSVCLQQQDPLGLTGPTN